MKNGRDTINSSVPVVFLLFKILKLWKSAGRFHLIFPALLGILTILIAESITLRGVVNGLSYQLETFL